MTPVLETASILRLRDRRQLERDLHDGAQQRLVSLALTLRMPQDKLDSEPGEARRLLDRSRDELNAALKELRELARGIHPAVLSRRGLAGAVEALADRAALPVEVGQLPGGTTPRHVELAAYYVVSEALTNVAKHAPGSKASVTAAKHDGRLTIVVSDNGVGGARTDLGSGLRGLSDRLAAIEADSTSRPNSATARPSAPASLPSRRTFEHRA